MRSARYPGVGAIIVHVIPSAWGPYVDLRASLQALSRKRPWTHVISPEEFAGPVGEDLKSDPDVWIVCWSLLDPGPRDQRRCQMAYVYSEALDDDGGKLLPDHLAHWHRFKSFAGGFDRIFAHTPSAATIVARAASPVHVLPFGYEPLAMGEPRVDAPKHRGLLFYGSIVGRREILVPYLRAELGDQLSDACGMFGRGLLGMLDTSRASLYIAHSDVSSFSTWRLFQTCATTAAMIAEPGDAWPFVAGIHYVEIPRLTISTARSSVEILRELISAPDHLNQIAHRAHHEIGRTFTMEHIEDRYLVPGFLGEVVA